MVRSYVWSCLSCKRKIKFNKSQQIGESFLDTDRKGERVYPIKIKPIQRTGSHFVWDKHNKLIGMIPYLYPLKCPHCGVKQVKFVNEHWRGNERDIYKGVQK